MKKYYIYHVPGVKVGVTTNLKRRVEEQQGYTPFDYDVLATTEDITEASKLEANFQKMYKYTQDISSYKTAVNLRKGITNKTNIGSIEVNVTDKTTTFPCSINKLKGRLMDSLGGKWTTDDGEFQITPSSIDWIMNNVEESNFRKGRCYIYNKAFSRDNVGSKSSETVTGGLMFHTPTSKFDAIRSWAKERGIYDKGDALTQYAKLMEEAGELAQALLKQNQEDTADAIGDMVVVLTNLAHLKGMKIETCINKAYDEIKNRKGSMVNGTFVKQTL
jgi:NTP pyrophosphatase (non-canonical NTP hydrolase)